MTSADSKNKFANLPNDSFADSRTWPMCYGNPNDPRTDDIFPREDGDITDDDSWTNAKTDSCPFCGGNASPEESDYQVYVVICESCGTEGPRRTDPFDAVAAWNHRQPATRPIPANLRRGRITELQEQQ